MTRNAISKDRIIQLLCCNEDVWIDEIERCYRLKKFDERIGFNASDICYRIPTEILSRQHAGFPFVCKHGKKLQDTVMKRFGLIKYKAYRKVSYGDKPSKHNARTFYLSKDKSIEEACLLIKRKNTYKRKALQRTVETPDSPTQMLNKMTKAQLSDFVFMLTAKLNEVSKTTGIEND